MSFDTYDEFIATFRALGAAYKPEVIWRMDKQTARMLDSKRPEVVRKRLHGSAKYRRAYRRKAAK